MKSDGYWNISRLALKEHPLASKTRFRSGGTALYYTAVQTITDLEDVINYAEEYQLLFYVLGGGSNVLISDDRFQGIVIALKGDFKNIAFDYENQTVTAGAGVPLIKLGYQIAQQGFSGCAYMGVIPGTVGGAVRMNAGLTPNQETKNDFLSAVIFDTRAKKIKYCTKEQMAFKYRKSMLSKTSDIVLSVTFRLPDSKEAVKHEAITAIKNLFIKRRLQHPHNTRTFGSVFKNPENQPQAAAWYLEKVGMKGLKVGDALVPQEHANWIVNAGKATSIDAKKIIAIGRQRVFETSGITLEREVVYLPEDIENTVLSIKC